MNRSALALVAFVALAACNTADFQGPVASSVRPCVAGPAVYCDAMAPGAGGCLGEPGSSDPSVRQFPTDASFALGCSASIVAGSTVDNCVAVQTCTCADVADAGDAGPRWTCSQ